MNLTTGIGSGADVTGDVLVSIESIYSSKFADSLFGNSSRNFLLGRDGNDKLNGVRGHDYLNGGNGQNFLTGGAGNDQFVYFKPIEGGDTITDFSSLAVGNDDLFYVQGAGFGKHKAGALLTSEFQSSNSAIASTAEVRFFFDRDDHKVYFDTDGNGAAAAVLLATVNTTAIVTVNDFLFF